VDRDEIERPDFPSARRGYDVEAVREHLRRVADEFEALGRSVSDRQATGSLAEGASSRVRAILEAAEASAQQLRDEARREASGHVARVEESARAMLAKIDHVQAELDRLLGGLRSTAEGVAGSLAELSSDAGMLRSADEAARDATPPLAAAAPVDGAATNGSRSTDEAGARLVALNMALEGAPREETGRYLAEHYDVPDVEALLDDVYASAAK
jgi:DivIVA domain-containing protein